MCYHVWLYSCIRSIYRKLSQQFWNCKFSTCTCTDLFCVSLSLARESYQKCCTFFIIIETHSVKIQLVQLPGRSVSAQATWIWFSSLLFEKLSPGHKNGLERRPSRFSTICAKNQLLKLNIDKVTVVLRRKPPSAPVGLCAQGLVGAGRREGRAAARRPQPTHGLRLVPLSARGRYVRVEPWRNRIRTRPHVRDPLMAERVFPCFTGVSELSFLKRRIQCYKIKSIPTKRVCDTPSSGDFPMLWSGFGQRSTFAREASSYV